MICKRGGTRVLSPLSARPEGGGPTLGARNTQHPPPPLSPPRHLGEALDTQKFLLNHTGMNYCKQRQRLATNHDFPDEATALYYLIILFVGYSAKER